jgi:hypothetical protein
MTDKAETPVDRDGYGKNRPGNASVAYVAETQLRDIQKTLPLRVLSEHDWKHWTMRGYVIVKQAIPPGRTPPEWDFMRVTVFLIVLTAYLAVR